MIDDDGAEVTYPVDAEHRWIDVVVDREATVTITPVDRNEWFAIYRLTGLSDSGLEEVRWPDVVRPPGRRYYFPLYQNLWRWPRAVVVSVVRDGEEVATPQGRPARVDAGTLGVQPTVDARGRG